MAHLLLALLVLAAPQVQSPTLAQALKAYDDLDYVGASGLLDRARAEPLAPDDRKLAEFYAGIVAFDLNQPEKAHEAFVRALELDPKLALGADASPKLEAFFADVRREVAARAPKPADVPPAGKPEVAPKPSTKVEALAQTDQAESGEKPLYAKPLFWVGVGATAAVVATGVFLFAHRTPACASTGNAGCLDIQVQKQGLASW